MNSKKQLYKSDLITKLKSLFFHLHTISINWILITFKKFRFLGLKGAIEAVYGSKEETQNKTNAQITTLNKEIQKLNTRLSKQKEELTTLYTHIGQLHLQINHIEDVIHSLPFGIGSKVKVKDGK